MGLRDLGRFQTEPMVSPELAVWGLARSVLSGQTSGCVRPLGCWHDIVGSK
jgi:hypothetical protein